jgi:hypothetical protein
MLEPKQEYPSFLGTNKLNSRIKNGASHYEESLAKGKKIIFS